MSEIPIPALGSITQEASKSDYRCQNSEVDEDHTGQRLKCRNTLRFNFSVLGALNKSNLSTVPASY